MARKRSRTRPRSRTGITKTLERLQRVGSIDTDCQEDKRRQGNCAELRKLVSPGLWSSPNSAEPPFIDVVQFRGHVVHAKLPRSLTPGRPTSSNHRAIDDDGLLAPVLRWARHSRLVRETQTVKILKRGHETIQIIFLV